MSNAHKSLPAHGTLTCNINVGVAHTGDDKVYIYIYIIYMDKYDIYIDKYIHRSYIFYAYIYMFDESTVYWTNGFGVIV